MECLFCKERLPAETLVSSDLFFFLFRPARITVSADEVIIIYIISSSYSSFFCGLFMDVMKPQGKFGL